MTPYYDHAGITIYLGDCREILPHLPKVDAVITDPPYGIAFDTDYRRFTSGFNVERKAHKAVHGDSEPFDPQPWLNFKTVVLWGANCFSSRLPMGSWLVWDKRFGNGTAFLADAEAAWMKGGHGIYLYAVTQQGCIRPEPIQHPTQKPVAVMEWCISKSKAEGLILDPFMGSGTTLVAAKNLGRKAIGIEIEERYCEIAVKRLSQEVFDFTRIGG
jgi:DNA modification methylase